jgi:hypothetical protein
MQIDWIAIIYAITSLLLPDYQPAFSLYQPCPPVKSFGKQVEKLFSNDIFSNLTWWLWIW